MRASPKAQVMTPVGNARRRVAGYRKILPSPHGAGVAGCPWRRNRSARMSALGRSPGRNASVPSRKPTAYPNRPPPRRGTSSTLVISEKSRVSRAPRVLRNRSERSSQVNSTIRHPSLRMVRANPMAPMSGKEASAAICASRSGEKRARATAWKKNKKPRAPNISQAKAVRSLRIESCRWVRLPEIVIRFAGL